MDQNKKEESYCYINLEKTSFLSSEVHCNQCALWVMILSWGWELKVDYIKSSGDQFLGHMKSYVLRNRWIFISWRLKKEYKYIINTWQ